MNEASTLGWGTRIKGFVACFVIGGVCTILVSTCPHCQRPRGVSPPPLLALRSAPGRTLVRVDVALQVLLALEECCHFIQ